MGPLRNLAGRRAAKVEARRVALIDGLLTPNEQVLAHTPVRSLVHPNRVAKGEELSCILYATDAQLVIAAFQGSQYEKPADLPGPDTWVVDYLELRHVVLAEAQNQMLLVVDRPSPSQDHAFTASLNLMGPMELFEPQLTEIHRMSCIPLRGMGPLADLQEFLETMGHQWTTISPELDGAPYGRFLRHRPN